MYFLTHKFKSGLKSEKISRKRISRCTRYSIGISLEYIFQRTCVGRCQGISRRYSSCVGISSIFFLKKHSHRHHLLYLSNHQFHHLLQLPPLLQLLCTNERMRKFKPWKDTKQEVKNKKNKTILYILNSPLLPTTQKAITTHSKLLNITKTEMKKKYWES